MPVVTGDLHPDTFGMGSFIFQNDTTEEPENPAAEEAAEADTDETDDADTDVVVWVDPAAEKTAPDDPDTDAADSDDAALPITEPGEGTGDAADGFEVRGNASPTGTEDEGETPQYLTYSSDHNYVLSSTFTVEQKASPAILMTPPMRASSDHVDGRDYFGQVSVDIDGTTYILIGDRQQLDAIDSNATTRTRVCGPVFYLQIGTVEVYRDPENHLLGDDWIWLTDLDEAKALQYGDDYLKTKNGYGNTVEEVIASKQALLANPTIIYPGDADLIDLGASGNFYERPLYDSSSGVYHALSDDNINAAGRNDKKNIYFTTNSSGVPDLSTAPSVTNVTRDPTVGTLKYEKDGMYIVFRDIDMTKGAVMHGLPWYPLMFTGEMYGVKASDTNPTLWDAGHTTLNLDVNEKPEIYNFQVEPIRLSNNDGDDDYNKLDIDAHIGVGFFATLTGKGAGNLTISAGADDPDSFDAAGDICVVRNLRLRDGTVNNPLTAAAEQPTVVNTLVDGLANVLGFALTELLRALTDKPNIGVDALSNALNSRAADPTNLATGAFAGRVIGNVRVLDCEVLRVSVTTVLTDLENPESTLLGNNNPKIVGKGGFVGHAEGVTSYSVLTKALGQLVTGLATVLNLVPVLGLGDLVTLLLDKLVPVGQLIPTRYTSPEITRCSVDNCTLSTEDGKYGVGGFAGSLAGVVVTDCTVKNCDMTVNADHFGGGFAGVSRDGVIKGLLSGLGIDVISLLHPQTELIRCSIENSTMNVTGGTFLGGFTGILANSYGINDTVDSYSTLTVTGTGDYIGGFTGQATLGSLFDLANYVEDSDSLLTVVKQALTSLIGTDQGQSLLDLSGVASAAILGWQNDAETTVASTGGNFAGGIVGKAEGSIIARSDETHLRKLSKYKRQRSGEYVNTLPAGITARDNHVTKLVSVSAGKDYAGGVAGHISTANVGGLLGSTLGLAEFVGFEVSHTYINGIDDTTGYTVETGTNVGDGPERGDYAGGAFGWAVGGDVYDVWLTQLGWVKGNNHVGGFVGATGPGNLANNEGLDLSLLGIQLLSANNVLSLISAQRTTYLRANVTGITAGYTVEETGIIENNATDAIYTAGGFVGDANSVRFVDCHANRLLSVTANLNDGRAGGFAARSLAGDIADAAEHVDTNNLANLLSVNQLLNAIPLLVPSYDGCDVNYVNGGFVEGDTAGGFAGEFMSGKVNTYTMETQEISGNTYTGVNPIDNPNTTYEYTVGNRTTPWSVNNIHHVRGGNYGGGWGGHVYPGALASAGGGLNVLNVADTSGISADDLLGVADVYIPIIKYAGVNAPNGFTVYAAHDYGAANAPATAGYAGGFIGYGQSVQISYSSVNKLAHRTVTEPDAFTSDDNSAYGRIGLKPDELESQDGSNYLNYSSNDPDEIPYAVAGAYYAGGYIGHMDIGSAASIGDNLSLLGRSISLSDVLGALNVVVSTIEHSNVYGMPGGFNVMASPRINLHNGTYGDADGKGVSYSGGYAGKISGGHIQDGNCYNFAYIIGEIAAGGYVGEMIPGEVAKVLPKSDLSIIGNTSSLASLAEDFVPTIRNSETTCIPCGGAIRAETPSDRTITRGMAGGYIGHCVGGQIWGMSNDRWKDDATYGDSPDEPERYCTAHRIRSVYGAEYAGGYVGFMEAGSTADVGSLSVLGGLLSVDNLLGTLNATYATIKRARVTGPLRGLDETTWNAWKQYVGANGQFSSELLTADFNDLEDFIYGTHVVAGRHKFANYPNTFLSGCAGGFAGSMHSGVIEFSECIDTKLVLAMRAAGGFAGEMQTGDLAKAGGISLLGLDINLGSLAPNLGSVLVPAIKDCEAKGYACGVQAGATGSIGNDTLEAPNDPTPATPELTDGYYLIGPDWTVNDIDTTERFEQNPADHSEFMLSTTLTEGDKIKVVKVESGAITAWYPDGLNNEYTVDAAHAGYKTIYFKPSYDGDWSGFGGYIYIDDAVLPPDPPVQTAEDDNAYGVPSEAGVGCAGGFVGATYGGQLEATAVRNLKRVKGTFAVGGYAGRANAAAIVSANTANASNGVLQQLLNAVLSSKSGLLDALHATVCTINDATVESIKDENGNYEPYGFVVDGEYSDSGTKYATYAGGFAGQMKATLVNTKKGSVATEGGTEIFTPDTEEGTTTVTVRYLRGVNGGHYAGGFVGLASVGSVAQLGGSSTNVLNLLSLGNVGLLDVFRTYIYRSTVYGVDEGVRVFAHDWEQPGGNLQATTVTGAAGGFAGGLMSGTIEDSEITNLNYVEAPNFSAGFVGHSGTKSVLNLTGAAVDTDSVLGKLLAVLGLDLSASLQLMNIIGSTFKRDTVTGFGGSNDGFITKATNVQSETSLGVEWKFIVGTCAAGFAGYADIAQIEDNCQALKLRKVISPQIAGGFVGRSSVAYLADLEASSDLVGALTWLVRLLLGVLGIGALENSGLIDLYGDILGIQVAADGYLVRLNLFGLVIGISAVSRDPETNKPTAVTVVLGSSEITLPIGPDGEVDATNLTVQLIELNRTAIRNGVVKGIDDGYDVFGGGATDSRSGDDRLGYAGGFIGLNDHGFVSNSTTELCDTVRGTEGKVGPFVGGTLYNENAQGPDRLEGNNNHYYIYREEGADYTAVYTEDGEEIAPAQPDTESVSGKIFNRYDVTHITVNNGAVTTRDLAYLSGAEERGAGEETTRLLRAYRSASKYVGMNDTPLSDNPKGLTPMPAERKDPCSEEPVEITIQKIWNDENDKQSKRPDSVAVTVKIVDVGSTTPPQIVYAGRPPSGADVVWTGNYTLTPGDTFSDTWSLTVTDLPYSPVENGTYYVYYVYEAVPEYYNVAYAVDQNTASVRMTNSIWLLPDTGGEGTAWLLLAGLLLLLCAILLLGASLTWKKWGTLTRRNTAA